MDDPEFGPGRDYDPLNLEPPGLTGEEDQLLVTSLRRWLRGFHVGSNARAVKAIERWMAVKGIEPLD